MTLNNLLPIFVKGLTYQGNLPHSLLNYSLIVLTLAPFIVFPRRSRAFTPRRWFGCLLIAVGVQVLLWLSVGAVGVSVVWCTMAGYGLMAYADDRSTHAPLRRRLFILALVSALIAIGYYAVTFPLLTTLAHGLAVVMGVGIFYLLRFLRIKRDAKQRV